MANRPNYAKQMDAVLAALGESRPRLLLHACCAPCSSSVLELLERHFAVTILYYDPNIWPDAEYRRRLEELRRFLQASGRAGTVLIEDKYRPEEFYAAVKGLEAEPERGGRCTVCYRMRMERAAAYAAANGYEWFCTTLSLSPHKDAGRINQIGQALAAKYGVRHLPSEFKKRDGYKRSLVLSGEYGLYRQDYCGCEFSARQSEARRAPAPEAAKTEKERPIMSQREKMHSGELYISMDEDILKEQFVCLEKQYDYNQTRPSEGARRAALLQEMMAECGEGCYIEPPLHANWGGHHVHLGKGVYANFNLTLVDDTHIYIGDYTMLGPNVVLATGGHPLLPELRDETYQYNLPIHIGKSCWLGAGVIVLPGVTIGDGSVIGAGSVVTRDIPPNVLAMGTPCRVVRGLDERDRETYFHGRRIDPDLLKK